MTARTSLRVRDIRTGAADTGLPAPIATSAASKTNCAVTWRSLAPMCSAKIAGVLFVGMLAAGCATTVS